MPTTGLQQTAFVDTETGEPQERNLEHRQEAFTRARPDWPRGEMWIDSKVAFSLNSISQVRMCLLLRMAHSTLMDGASTLAQTLRSSEEKTTSAISSQMLFV